MILHRIFKLKFFILLLFCIQSCYCQINFISEDLKLVLKNSKDSIFNIFNADARTATNFDGYDEETCNNHLAKIFDGVTNITSGTVEFWILELLDPWGKIPSGLLSGHLRELGNFDQCLRYQKSFDEEPNLASLRGQYCTATIPFDVIKKLLGMDKSREAAPGPFGGGPQGISLGTCVPDKCSPTMLNDFFKRLLELVGSSEVNATIIGDNDCSKNESKIFEPVDYVAISFFSIVGIIMVLSSIYDYILRMSSKKGHPKQLFIAFSVVTNGEKLFKISTQKSPHVISCLNGLRCISIVWVVFGHAYVMYASISLVNGVDTLNWFSSPFAATLVFGTISVDTFFFLSGLLIIWGAFRELEKSKGKLNIPLMYLHRFLRLTPVLAAMILFCVSLARYVGSGPFWKMNIKQVSEDCQDYWWLTILYVQNYVQSEGQGICIPHSWYLAVDTQLYVLSPLVLIPLWKWGRKAVIPIVVLALLSNIFVFTIFMIYGFSTIKALDASTTMDRMRLTYMPTHARYAPWLVGILLGYFLYETKNKRIKFSKVVTLSGWLISLGTILAVIFGPYNRTQEGGGFPTAFESSIYEALSRTTWAIALAWIVFACHNGYGGVINSILSWPMWEPFSRLTYSIYIIHFILQYLINGNTKVDKYFSDMEVILKFWGDFGLTVMISIVSVLAFESPIIGIEKILFKKEGSKQAHVHHVEANGGSKQILVN